MWLGNARQTPFSCARVPRAMDPEFELGFMTTCVRMGVGTPRLSATASFAGGSSLGLSSHIYTRIGSGGSGPCGRGDCLQQRPPWATKQKLLAL